MKQFAIFLSVTLLSIIGCRQALELTRGKSIASVNSSGSDLLRGIVPAAKIDPNFVRMRINSIDTDQYPDSVHAMIVLSDERGNFIPDMAPPYDHLFDWKTHWNEVVEKVGDEHVMKKPIPEYSVREVSYRDRTPIAIALVLDHSGSMKGRTVELEYASENLTFLKREIDAMSIVKFDDRVFTEVKLMTDKKEIFARNQRDGVARFGGKRAIYDACMEGINEVKDFAGEKILILFTCGVDNASNKTSHDVIQYARDRDVKIFVVAADQVDEETLTSMARMGNGRYVYAKTLGELESLVEDIYRSLLSYYVLSYKPPLYFGRHEVRVQTLLPNASGDIATASMYMRDVFDPYAPVGSVAPLQIEFEFNRADIKQESFRKLDEVVSVCKTFPSMKLEIRGHIDQVGKPDFNKKLSEQRANSIKNYFMKAGIEANRIPVTAFGSSKPVANNDTEENRRLNRRMEFVIVGK